MGQYGRRRLLNVGQQLTRKRHRDHQTAMLAGALTAIPSALAGKPLAGRSPDAQSDSDRDTTLFKIRR